MVNYGSLLGGDVSAFVPAPIGSLFPLCLTGSEDIWHHLPHVFWRGLFAKNILHGSTPCEIINEFYMWGTLCIPSHPVHVCVLTFGCLRVRRRWFAGARSWTTPWRTNSTSAAWTPDCLSSSWFVTSWWKSTTQGYHRYRHTFPPQSLLCDYCEASD